MRTWHELVAAIGDRVPGGVTGAGLFLLGLTILVALLWYTWPAWWRRPRWRLWWPRRRGRVATVTAPAEAEPVPDDELPELPAVTLAMSADELAARGRYREAVRERLRAIVRELVERGVVDSAPGWTVLELAGMAAQVRPPTAAPLGAAGEVFARIWYGQQAATAADDAAMRAHAAGVRAALVDPRVPA